MRLPNLLVLRSLLLAFVGFGVNSDAGSITDRGDNSTKRTRLAQAFSSDIPTGGFRLGIETQKRLQTPESLRPTGCVIDDECDQYLGVPKSEAGRKAVKNFKKPFIGLSITAPLQ
jgi:hypothetical protein